MAEQLIPNIYEQTGEAFNRKLDTLVGFAQQVKRNQLVKQQQAEQFARQKDLVQFRADVQLEKQKQYFQEVTRPQQEAERQRQQLEEYQDKIQASMKQAKENMRDNIDEFHSNKYMPVQDYNLLDVKFGTKTTDSGLVTDAIYVNVGNEQGEDAYREVDYQQYKDVLTRTTEFAEFLDKLKQKEQEGELAELSDNDYQYQEMRGGKPVTVSRIGKQNAKRYLANIRQNPQFRLEQMKLHETEQLKIADSSLRPEGEGGGGEGPQSALFPAFGNLMATLNSEPIRKYGNTIDEPLLAFWRENDRQIKSEINYQADIQSVQKQIRLAMNDIYNIDPSQLQSSEQVRAILQGNTSVLDGDLADYAERVQRDDKLKELFQAYDFFINAYSEYSTKAKDPTRPDKLVANFQWNSQNIADAFKPIEDNAKVNAAALHYHKKFMKKEL